MDLDQCIEVLSKHQILNCALHFTANLLPDEKIIQLSESLKTQKNLKMLSLTASLEPKNADELATHLGSIFASLQNSLESLIFRGLFADNSSNYLAELIQNSTSLAQLSVGVYNKEFGYVLPEQGAVLIAEALKTNKSLRCLDLSSNKIQFNGALAIAQALTINEHLQKIDLRDNSIKWRQESEILEALQSNQSLREIYLDATLITPSALKMWIRNEQEFAQPLLFIAKANNLIHLQLTVEKDLAEQIAPELGLILTQMNSLQQLRLFGFSNTSFGLLYQIILTHPTLEHLTFRMDDSLNDYSANFLVFLIQSSKLRSLSIGASRIDDNYSQMNPPYLIFPALKQNTSLTHIDLSNNCFENWSQTAAGVVGVLKQNKCLKSINLSNVFRATNGAAQIILTALEENKTVVSLDLSSNRANISDEIVGQIEKKP